MQISFSKFICLAIISLATVSSLQAQVQKPTVPKINLGKNTPLMGWASWNNFRAEISETILKNQADAMIKVGLPNAGYQYFNIDDGFFAGRDEQGNLIIDKNKFPKGMKDMADYIHSKGLKAGIYSEAGSNTCGSIWDAQKGGINAGMYTHEQRDANLFFKTWGYDYLKVDYCGAQNQGLDEQKRYTDIKNAILATGRKDVQFNVCRWEFPGTWVMNIANSWRISHDLFLRWSSVIEAIDKNSFLAAYCSPGHYNDMDMLQVGRGFTEDEDKAHFSIWAIMSSPLMLGNDLTKINDYTLSIITNPEIIALNQDPTGLQAQLVKDDGKGLQVFAKALNGKQSNERGVVLFNRSNTAQMMSVSLNDINLTGVATVRDLWLHKDMATIDKEYTVMVPSHGAVALKIVGKNKLKQVFEAEYAYLNNFNHLKYTTIMPNQATVVRDSSCSGLAKAVSIGNNKENWMEFRDVVAPKDGVYEMTISYMSPDDKTIEVLVNGIKTKTIKNLNTGSKKTIALKIIPVSLKKGNNIIRFYNDIAYIPDIDKISFKF